MRTDARGRLAACLTRAFPGDDRQNGVRSLLLSTGTGGVMGVALGDGLLAAAGVALGVGAAVLAAAIVVVAVAAEQAAEPFLEPVAPTLVTTSVLGLAGVTAVAAVDGLPAVLVSVGNRHNVCP